MILTPPTFLLHLALEPALCGQPLMQYQGNVYVPFHAVEIKITRYGHLELVYSTPNGTLFSSAPIADAQLSVQQFFNNLIHQQGLSTRLDMHGAIRVATV